MVEHSRKPAKKSRRKKDMKITGDIWKQFPHDVMETILAKLPLPTISRFRSVSRDWNSLLTSNTFSRTQLQQQQQGQPYPWIYTTTREKNNPGIMYDHCSRKWYQSPIVLPNPNFVPKASAGGLVCFMDVSHPTSLYVCNPLTKSIKQLPSRSVPLCSQSGVGMVLMNRNSNNYDHYDHCYKIVCLGSLGEFEVYDSITNSWILSHMPAATIDAPLDLDRWSQYVAIETTLYFIRKTPDAIVSFDVASGAWQQFVIPFPLHSTEHRIAEWRGKLLVVGLLREERTCACLCCVWELDRMGLVWKEIDRIPWMMCLDLKLYRDKMVSMICLGNRGGLLLMAFTCTYRMVSYNMETRAWQKVPYLPGMKRRRRIGLGTGSVPCLTAAAFHPCLTASP